jgi:hypothetical protein
MRGDRGRYQSASWFEPILLTSILPASARFASIAGIPLCCRKPPLGASCRPSHCSKQRCNSITSSARARSVDSYRRGPPSPGRLTAFLVAQGVLGNRMEIAHRVTCPALKHDGTGPVAHRKMRRV